MPAAPMPARSVTLSWDYPNWNGSFNVRCLRTNQVACPVRGWPIVTNTTAHGVKMALDMTAKCVWFAVTAVDTNGIESEFGH